MTTDPAPSPAVVAGLEHHTPTEIHSGRAENCGLCRSGQWLTVRRGWEWKRGDLQIIRIVNEYTTGGATQYAIWRGETDCLKMCASKREAMEFGDRHLSGDARKAGA